MNVLLNKIKVTWAKLIYSFHSFLQLVYNWSYLAYLYTFRLQLKFSLYLKLLLVLCGVFPISPHFTQLKNYILVIVIMIEIIWLIDIRNLPNECGWNKQIKSESFRLTRRDRPSDTQWNRFNHFVRIVRIIESSWNFQKSTTVTRARLWKNNFPEIFMYNLENLQCSKTLENEHILLS